MRAYASMYRPFRPTAISGHTRLTAGHTRVISGHKMAETYHAIQITSSPKRWRRSEISSFELLNTLSTSAGMAGIEWRECAILAIWDQRGVFRRACQKAMRSGISSSAGESWTWKKAHTACGLWQSPRAFNKTARGFVGFEITGPARPPQSPPQSPRAGRARFEHCTHFVNALHATD